jgi:hypothetical protein
MAFLFATTSWMAFAGLFCVLLVVSGILHNLYIHRLRRFPGPLLGRCTRLYSSYIRALGLSERKVLEWHEKYGPIVRIAPDERR